jgi:hypothetical protein
VDGNEDEHAWRSQRLGQEWISLLDHGPTVEQGPEGVWRSIQFN